jgi:hypothetical protein
VLRTYPFGAQASQIEDAGTRRVHGTLAVVVAACSPKQACHLPLHPTATLAGTGQIAPSSVQQRTMSRTDRTPTVSPRCRTIR